MHFLTHLLIVSLPGVFAAAAVPAVAVRQAATTSRLLSEEQAVTTHVNTNMKIYSYR